MLLTVLISSYYNKLQGLVLELIGIECDLHQKRIERVLEDNLHLLG